MEKKRIAVLMGSPRSTSNTEELCQPFLAACKGFGAEVHYLRLADLNIAPCRGCYACQNVAGEYGCVQQDDMLTIVNEILWADLLVLATPIYAFYCAAPMKNMLDRHYGLNKFYGSAEGSLWAGKQVAVIATHGYDADYATKPFELGVQHLCEHSNLNYVGIYSVQDNDDLASFQTEEAKNGAIEFARTLLSK